MGPSEEICTLGDDPMGAECPFEAGEAAHGVWMKVLNLQMKELKDFFQERDAGETKSSFKKGDEHDHLSDAGRRRNFVCSRSPSLGGVAEVADLDPPS